MNKQVVVSAKNFIYQLSPSINDVNLTSIKYDFLSLIHCSKGLGNMPWILVVAIINLKKIPTLKLGTRTMLGSAFL